MSTQEKLDIQIPYQQPRKCLLWLCRGWKPFGQRWNVRNSKLLQSSTTSAMLDCKKLQVRSSKTKAPTHCACLYNNVITIHILLWASRSVCT